jgi:DNA-binding transcriptional LysR family regulator
MKQVSSWRGIEEFLAVVACGSFSAAGDELGVSKSYLSKTVRELESRLGVQLLVRTTRSISLTGAGESFYRECSELQERLTLLERRVGRFSKEPVGRLRIALSGNFGTDFMTTYLAEFSNKHPAIKVEAIAYLNPKEIVQERFDVAIRYGDLKDSNMRARVFGYLSHCVCASPAYVEQFGWPKAREEFLAHRCVTDMSGAISFNDLPSINVPPFWMSNSAIALRSAVKRGLGIASLPVAVVRQELQEGSIIALEEEWSYYDKACWAVYAPGMIAASARAFIDYLVRRTSRLKIRPSSLASFNSHF